jgi:SAM-dependent methyltransferase
VLAGQRRDYAGETFMSDPEIRESLDFWNRVAKEWQTQVDNDGDRNRILNSDPVLWKFVGDVRGLEVLDAGCGTGYLSKKLWKRGARVSGVDFSEKMIDIARTQYPDINFYVDSCSDLRNIDDRYFDLVISNYVLMDTCLSGASKLGWIDGIQTFYNCSACETTNADKIPIPDIMQMLMYSRG